MTTRAEHAAEAERLLAEAGTIPGSSTHPDADRLLARAQVHATLATVPEPARAATAPATPKPA